MKTGVHLVLSCDKMTENDSQECAVHRSATVTVAIKPTINLTITMKEHISRILY